MRKMKTTEIPSDILQTALEQCPSCAVVAMSRSGRVVMWNRGAERLTGWRAEEAKHQPLSFWIAGEEDESALVRKWLADVTERGWIDVTTRRRHSDGSEVVATSSLGPLRVGSRVVGLLDMTRTLGEDSAPSSGNSWRPNAGEALMHTQKLESLGVMAGGIAHDFNNLLTAILGNASLVLRDMPADGASRGRVQDIRDAARRAANLTRQLLAYSGKAKFEVRALDLSAHVREIAHLMRACISKNSQLRLDLAAEMPAVQADVAQLQQVVMNLVVNAAEAIGEDASGDVTVTTGVKVVESDSGRHLIGASLAPGPYAFVRVADTGCGIPKSARERIFDPFFTTKSQGRGLGLAAVLGILAAHDGALGLETRLGSGSRFTAFFPIAPGPAEDADRTGSFRFTGSGRVLVVDDEACVRSVARQVLSELGFDVAEAEDGKKAVAMVTEEPDGFVAVLLDVAMPVMGGVEAFARLREIRPDLTIIMSSGYSEANAVERLRAGKPSGFLSKPYSAGRLAEVFMTAVQAQPGSGHDRGPSAVGS